MSRIVHYPFRTFTSRSHFILDIAAYIYNATNIHSTFSQGDSIADELKQKLESVCNQDTLIVTYCAVGLRSSWLAKYLGKKGYRNVKVSIHLCSSALVLFRSRALPLSCSSALVLFRSRALPLSCSSALVLFRSRAVVPLAVGSHPITGFVSWFLQLDQLWNANVSLISLLFVRASSNFKLDSAQIRLRRVGSARGECSGFRIHHSRTRSTRVFLVRSYHHLLPYSTRSSLASRQDLALCFTINEPNTVS